MRALCEGGGRRPAAGQGEPGSGRSEGEALTLRLPAPHTHQHSTGVAHLLVGANETWSDAHAITHTHTHTHKGGGKEREIYANPNLINYSVFFQSEGRWYTGKVLGVSLKLG